MTRTGYIGVEKGRSPQDETDPGKIWEGVRNSFFQGVTETKERQNDCKGEESTTYQEDSF